MVTLNIFSNALQEVDKLRWEIAHLKAERSENTAFKKFLEFVNWNHNCWKKKYQPTFLLQAESDSSRDRKVSALAGY